MCVTPYGVLPMTKLFSFDAETNGLYGQAFALAAIVTNESGEAARFIARCPIESKVNPWVAENVLPTLDGLAETHTSYREMLEAFYAFYKLHKEGSTVIAHVAHPVETKVLRDMVELDLAARMWDGPLLTDVHQALATAKENPWSVDEYLKKHGLAVPFEGATHHPLFDSWAAEVAYRHLTS